MLKPILYDHHWGRGLSAYINNLHMQPRMGLDFCCRREPLTWRLSSDLLH